MRKRSTTLLLLPALCLLVPAGANAQSAPQPEIDCKSAKVPKVDSKTYRDVCRARAAGERSQQGISALSGPTVMDNQTQAYLLNTSNVPFWTDPDILAQFPLQRDARYMTHPSNPSFQRRITWMYPDDYCFARAEQVAVRVAQAGKTRPHKLFAFGNSLRVSTDNHPQGEVFWWYHVVPAVRNNAGELIVFDAALSPCKPLPWRKWLALMVGDPSLFDTPGSGFTVALGDSWAYVPFSLASGEPSHSAESLNDEITVMPSEWSRQVELGRDPNVVLGATPPWSGYNCLSTEPEELTTTLEPGVTTTLHTPCPFGTMAVGGGWGLSSPNLKVSKSQKSGNGWQIQAKNVGSGYDQLTTSTVCLTGAPANAGITIAAGNQVNISAGSFATSNATCGTSSKLIGGGYVTTLGSGSNPVMRVYANRRSTTTGQTWQVSAQNTTSSTKSVTSIGYCLVSAPNLTTDQISGTLTWEGIAEATCSSSKATLGGGFVFPRTTNYNLPLNKYASWNLYRVDMAPAPGGSGDPSSRAYAQCLAHP